MVRRVGYVLEPYSSLMIGKMGVSDWQDGCFLFWIAHNLWGHTVEWLKAHKYMYAAIRHR